jgi:hypothetical protein
MSLYVLSPVESPKVCWCLLGRQSLRENQQRCSLHRRERSVARGRTVRDLGKARVSCLTGQTVRACTGTTKVAGGAWIPVREERS